MEKQVKIPTPQTGGGGMSRSAKAIIFWFCLILMFVAIYQLLAVSPRAAHSARPEPAIDGATASYWTFTVVAAMVAVFITIRVRGVRWFNSKVHAANGLIARGQLAPAVEIYERLARRRLHLSKSLKSMARHNLGAVRILQGRYQDAIELLASVESKALMNTKGGLAELNAWSLTAATALRGDLDAAQQWLDESVRRKGEQPMDKWLYVTPLLRCRQGRFGEAAGFIDDHIRESQSLLTGRTLKVQALFRAFAESARGPREGGRLAELLPAAKPIQRGDHDYLAKAWPELAQFLTFHGFAAATDAAPETGAAHLG